MGFDYCTVDGSGHAGLPSLRGWEIAIVLSALSHAMLLDEHRPPAEPQSMLDRAASPESFSDDENWPLDVELPAQERAWFEFRSLDPTRVPAVKIVDNAPWIIVADECALLRGAIEEILAGERPRRVDAWVFTRLAERGLHEGAARAEIERYLQLFSEIAAAGEHAGGVWSY